MDVGVIGINFKTASFLLRETVAKEVQSLGLEPCLLYQDPLVILMTCNRVEIYFSTPDVQKTKAELMVLLQEKIEESLEPYCYFYFDWKCFFHLCFVASGLDSAILGETEILRQVKGAYLRASKAYLLPSTLHYMFQKAFRVAKSNRHRFFLEQKMPSLLSTLWQVMSKFYEDLRSLKVLLVGYSEIHREFAAFLNYKKVEHIHFCTRQPEKAKGGTKIHSRDELNNWTDYDVISCATISDNFLIHGKGVKKHILFDLSMPRTISPEVSGSDVFLFNLEQINAIFEDHKTQWQSHSEEAERSLEEHALRLFRLHRSYTEQESKIAF